MNTNGSLLNDQGRQVVNEFAFLVRPRCLVLSQSPGKQRLEPSAYQVLIVQYLPAASGIIIYNVIAFRMSYIKLLILCVNFTLF